MPVAAAAAALAVPALSEFLGENRREFGLPRADGFMAEDDPALEEHLGQVAQGQGLCPNAWCSSCG